MHKIRKNIALSFMMGCMLSSSAQAIDDTTKAFIAGVCTTIAIEAVIIATPIVMYVMSTSEWPKKENNVPKENHKKTVEDVQQKKAQALKKLQEQKAEAQRQHDRIYLMSC